MNLVNLLKLGERELISAVGGGGKTTFLTALAEQLVKMGKKVFLSTTTKIFFPNDIKKFEVIINSESEVLKNLEEIESKKILVAGSRVVEGNKIAGFTKGFINDLYGLKMIDYMLIEADGSKRKPVKFHADYEPVIPESSTKVLGIIGLDCMGKPLDSEICHRAEEFCSKTGYKMGERIDERMIADLVVRENGLFKTAPENSEKILVLNKADDALRREWAFKIVDEIDKSYKKKKLGKIVVISFKENILIEL